jgi:hypothetical protein
MTSTVSGCTNHPPRSLKVDKKQLKRIREATVMAMGMEEEDQEMCIFRATVPPWIVLKLLFEIDTLQRKLDKPERKK